MGGDYTRLRYNPLKDISGVFLQQGRAMLEQDFNQQVQLNDRHWRAETMDIMGRAVVPSDTPHAFEVLLGGPTFTIGVGRMYVDGLLAENHGLDPTDPTKRTYDPILGELVGNFPIPYEQQPYYPNPPAIPVGGPYLAYLDAHLKENTYLTMTMDDIVDKALGVDTCTLTQTVWQVKVIEVPPGTDCSTPPSSIPAWVKASAPSAGQLTTAAAGAPSSTDPCIVPTTGGYRGAGNRNVRLEIHDGGPLGTATCKFSWDNASVASKVTAINAALDTLTVVLTRRDSFLRFQPNDWVEITDEFRYFQGLPGEMHQVASVDDLNRTIQLKTPLTAGMFDATKPERFTRVIRWDQKGIIRDTAGNPIVDVDTSGGLIPVPAAGKTFVIGDGIQVTITIDPSLPLPELRALTYWNFYARMIDASVEILTKAPPRGILHHYAWLGFVTLPGGPTPSCRIPWPPATEECCDCTICVSPASHNSGALTIQAAVNKMLFTGGKLCLSAGNYLIRQTIDITRASNIEISGHGLSSLIAVNLGDGQPIIRIQESSDIDIYDVAFIGPDPSNAPLPIPGVVIANSLFTRLTHCLFLGFISPSGESTLSPGVAYSRMIWNNQVHDSLFYNTGVGVGFRPNESSKTLFVALSSVQNNELFCVDAGFNFSNKKISTGFLDLVFSDNVVTGPLGFQFEGLGLDIAVERNTFIMNPVSTFGSGFVRSAAIVCNASQARISDNQIFGNPIGNSASGIVFPEGVMYGTQVFGNRLDNLVGTGILQEEMNLLLGTTIEKNQLLNIGGPGILMNSIAMDTNISDNALGFVSQTITPGFPVMSGIQLRFVFNLNLNQNEIEAVGLNPAIVASRRGIFLEVAVDARVEGNRILDIGPSTHVLGSWGISVHSYFGRAHVLNNEVRRASVPPAILDTSRWLSLDLLALGDVSVRGNLLESFGIAPTVRITATGSCIFADNQCRLDNPAGSFFAIAVWAIGNVIVVPNNVVQVPAAGGKTVMQLGSKDPNHNLTVSGNVTSGPIEVLPGPGPLPPTWAPLNVINV
jgi:hypothetical protein